LNRPDIDAFSSPPIGGIGSLSKEFLIACESISQSGRRYTSIGFGWRKKMAVIDHLLVATDGSAGALKAAAFAGELARALDARVSVLCVLSDELILPHAWGTGEYPAGPVYGSMSIVQVREMLEKHAYDNELPETVKALGKLGKEVRSVVLWGQPADEICGYAKDQDVQLIVIGSHGRSGLKEALLGSVSHKVANRASCPVTIVR
jgi:nucleotide-binding universal stress UspA family protein